MRKRVIILITVLCFSPAVFGETRYPVFDAEGTLEVVHGTRLMDHYRRLEEDEDPAVQEWTEAQRKMARTHLDSILQREWWIRGMNRLMRYDDQSTPSEVIEGDRLFFWSRKKDDEKWVYNMKKGEDATAETLLDPNKWDAEETLDFVKPSRDGRYVAYGKARGGDENAVACIMDTDTGKILPDRLRGWKQRVISWLPGNKGFYYWAHPLKGEVPEGEEYFWHAVYRHELGAPASHDKKIFSHGEKKDYYHSAFVSEDGEHVIYYRYHHGKNEVFLGKPGEEDRKTPLATGFDASYSADVVEDKIFITTDSDAPRYKVYVTDVDKPEREHWKEFLPEEEDKLSYINPVAGHIYAVYNHNAYTLIRIYSLVGKHIRDLNLPGIGTAGVSGFWSKPDVWLRFTSYTYPATTFKYHFDKNELELYRKFPVEVDMESYETDQVWYESKDGTSISMFLIHHKETEKQGENPVLLYGYGGFNVSETPHFSVMYYLWLEAGGMAAIPNLRGGGEYGEEWHQAGMLENKQNTFDDFISAAEWLIEQGYTKPEKLAVYGSSNGGLLAGAAAVQRPDLFKAVVSENPLLDMVRYHKFGVAEAYAGEYGTAEDKEQFRYLLEYSPYHNIRYGRKYPAILFIAAENDARVEPLHARKTAARMQEADPNGYPILLLVRKASGHAGGTTLSVRIEQLTDLWAFMADQVGLQP